MRRTRSDLHWVKWNVIPSSRYNGRLSVGSLVAVNQALFYKWRSFVLRLIKLMLVRLIKSCYKIDSGFS